MAIRLQRRAPVPKKAGPDHTPAFRFGFAAAARYRPAGAGGELRPLFRRWEAVGLLLLVTVGAASIPGGRGVPPAGTVLMEAAASGDLRARFFCLAPPLLAFLFAWRASGRLVRPFTHFAPVAITVSLAAIAVFIAFHVGLFLALQAPGTAFPARVSPWVATLPGALLGWGLILVVASIRLLWRRVAADLKVLRAAKERDRDDR